MSLNIKELSRFEKETTKAEELYQLLSSYSAFCTMLLRMKNESEGNKIDLRKYDDYCFRQRIESLLALFKRNECLHGKVLDRYNARDILFLINPDTLLRINVFDNNAIVIPGIAHLSPELIRINNCVGKTYSEKVFHRDPYYCEEYYEDRDAFGLFYDSKMVTPPYEITEELKKYDGKDIRDILRVQSFDDIYDKITEAKNQKIKKLTLS